MRARSGHLFKKLLTFCFFIIVPIVIGVTLCAVVIYGGKNVYVYVQQSLKPITYVASPVIEKTKPIVAELTGAKPEVQIGQVNGAVHTSELAAQLIEIPNIYMRDDLVSRLKVMLPHNPNLSLTSDAYIAADLTNGTILLEKNGTKAYPIASLTKLVTAAVAKDLIDDSKTITITPASYYTEGDTGKLKLNERVKAADLYYPMLMVSSNDAAEAFANSYDRNAFIKAMNNKVAAWGAPHTHFYDASGLNAANVSTPEDLLKIVQGLYKSRRDVISITHTKTKSIAGHTWTNPTHFLNLSSYIGGKNGYTEEADRTAVSLFAIPDVKGNVHPVAIIILQSDDRDNDVLKIESYLENIY